MLTPDFYQIEILYMDMHKRYLKTFYFPFSSYLDNLKLIKCFLYNYLFLINNGTQDLMPFFKFQNIQEREM